MKKLLHKAVWGALLLLVACDPVIDRTPSGPYFDKTAYRPIYAKAAELARIESQPSRALLKPGKIYVKDNYLFVNDLGEGIHIIDNRDPASPQKISFLKILANYDIAVKGSYLYADNGRDLVVLDIRDPLMIKFVKRIENAIPQNDFPPYANVWFECVDTKQGSVVGWEKVYLPSPPTCFRN